MTFFPEDITSKIRKDFGDEFEIAFKALENYARTNPREGHRLYRCIIYVAHGNIERMREAIDLARIDYRDLIMWAEYEGESIHNAIQVRDFTKSFGKNLK